MNHTTSYPQMADGLAISTEGSLVCDLSKGMRVLLSSVFLSISCQELSATNASPFAELERSSITTASEFDTDENSSPARFKRTGGASMVGPSKLPLPTGKVVEFYNTILDNYFITANADEVVAVDSGSAGAGWKRTGNTFNSGGEISVCRFYGSLVPGPNSHFYTADSNECAFLKQLQVSTPATDKRWNFESLDFTTTQPDDQTCPEGTTPVFRAYNNGALRNTDSNHRITSDSPSIQDVKNRGWTYEGIVMCAPN